MTSKAKSRGELITALTSAKGVAWHLFGFSMFINLLMLTGPLYMLQVYDRVLSSQSVPTLIALTVLILALYSTLGLLEWVRSGILSASASRFEDILGDRAVSASMSVSLSDAGRASDKPLRDLRTIRRFLSGPVLNTVFDAPWSPIFFIVLFMLHPFFGLWSLFGGVVLVALGLLNQRLTAHHMQQTEESERLAQTMSLEMVRSAEIIEALGMRPHLQARWKKAFDQSDSSLLQSSQKLAVFTSITKAFRLFLQSAILGLGAWLVIRGTGGNVTAGELVAASILMGRAIAPVEQLVAQWRSIVATREAWAALTQSLERTPPVADVMQLPPITGQVTVENAFAGPPGSRKPFLQGVSFKLEPGDVIGILGPSAAGKSTLARVIAGLWPAMSGAVRLDGAELSFFQRDQLGRQIGYLPQQSDLMSGTIRDNICRFDPNAQADAIIEAAQAAACHDLILHLPDGYDTEVGQAGAYLSAGQRQRIALARALFGNPKLVVLDEPNSNLDAQGDEALQSAILGLRLRKATTIIVAHRPNAIIHCDKLLVLNAGKMVTFGPRDEVLATIKPKVVSPNVTSIHPRTESNG